MSAAVVLLVYIVGTLDLWVKCQTAVKVVCNTH